MFSDLANSINPTQASAATQPPDPVQVSDPTQLINQADSESLALLDRIISEAETQSTPDQSQAPVSPPQSLSSLVAQTAPQAAPLAMLQTISAAEAQLQPQAGASAKNKETLSAASPQQYSETSTAVKPEGNSNQATVEVGGNVQYVEYEPSSELPPEVEGYLNRVEDHADQAPAEIVIADSIAAMPTQHQLPSQPVVVLPITPEIEKIGATKSPKFSIRWLVEWSHKIVKMFLGKVIYRQVTTKN
ncbi:MAG TPA: hypothetical protein DEP87_00600 [Candidatus Pacebacteria bacterium]|nr:hypothetical protein [Candidatus Paceibacterota bacterium]